MHLNTETAFDWIDGKLDGASEAVWVEHVATCTDCLVSMEEWRGLRESLRRQHLESAPPSMVDSAVAMFRSSPPVEQKSQVRRLIAYLAFDSLAQPAFAGARGVAAARQIVLRAEEFDIHIRISMSDENRELLGQIQPRSNKQVAMDSARLHLLHNGERIGSAEANDLGEFHFSCVPEDLLSLQIDLPHLTVIGTLDVSERI